MLQDQKGNQYLDLSQNENTEEQGAAAAVLRGKFAAPSATLEGRKGLNISDSASTVSSLEQNPN